MRGHVPLKRHLWNLKSEFSVILRSGDNLPFIYSQPLKNGKKHSSLLSRRRTGSSWVWPSTSYMKHDERGTPYHLQKKKNLIYSHLSVLKMKETTLDIWNLVWLALQELILPVPAFLECSVFIGLDKHCRTNLE